MKNEMQISYNGVLYRFDEAALRGVPDPVITASVSREGAGELVYRIYAQRKQGDHYVAYHGCSFCSLASLIGAASGSPVGPAELANGREALANLNRGLRLPGRLARHERMPLNIAGACRILQQHGIGYDLLDGGSSEELRAFITEKASAGLPILLTGKSVPSLTGADLFPRGAHTVLLIGMKDQDTLIAADSAGFNTQRIKFVAMDDLLSGILTRGARRGMKSGRYFYAHFPGDVRGGVAALRSWPEEKQV